MRTPLRLLTTLVFAGSVVAPLRAADPVAPAIPPRYVPCQFARQERAQFPFRLMQQGITRGEVRLTVEVGLDGRVGDRLLTAYSHRDFADEALRVVGESKFTPGRIDGQPVISILNLNFSFEINGVLVYARLGPPPQAADGLEGSFAYVAHGPSTLDRAPAALLTPGPVYPREWIAEGRRGRITVDFYIDEKGWARMPVALENGDEWLGAAAIAAVKQWRFEPPLRRGKPVLAHAQQVFVFKPDTPITPSPDA